MKNILKRLGFVFILFLNLLFGGLVSAEDTPLEILAPSTSIHLSIVSGENTLFDENISVLACDSDNDETTPEIITPYCAILQTGLSSEWNWSWAPGAFVEKIEDVAGFTSQDEEGNDIYHYWGWSLNDEEAMIALNQYELEVDDTILLEFISPVTENEDEEDGEESGDGGRNSSGSSINNAKVFSIIDAVNFLKANQDADGSFINDLYTDWVAIGLGKVGDEADSIKEKLIKYLSDNFSSDVLTDYQRRAMALMSLGVDPYLGTDINYIEKIVDSFDDQQIGDASIYNDDIFGIIVLSKAGYDSDDEIILKTIDFIISNQESDGSWEGVDLTGAAIQALVSFEELDGVSDSIAKAFGYLEREQQNNGGFGNSFSTSWATQAISLDNSYFSQTKRAIEYLTSKQNIDGGLEEISNPLDNRIWATAYALPAILKLSWTDILDDFSIPKEDKLVSVNKAEGELDEETNILEQKENEEINYAEITPEIVLATPISGFTEKISEKNQPKELGEQVVFQEEKVEKIVDENKDISQQLLLAEAASSVNQEYFFSSKNIVLLVLVAGIIIFSIFVFKSRV